MQGLLQKDLEVDEYLIVLLDVIVTELLQDIGKHIQGVGLVGVCQIARMINQGLDVFGVDDPLEYLFTLCQLRENRLGVEDTLEIGALGPQTVNQSRDDLMSLLIQYLAHLLLSVQILRLRIFLLYCRGLLLFIVALFLSVHLFLGRNFNLHKLNQELSQRVMLKNFQ